MSGLLNAFFMLVLHTFREQVAQLIMEELAGESVNRERIAHNVALRLNTDPSEFRARFKEMLTDGQVSEEEARELKIWADQL